jgi:hypothetical protein
VGVCMCVLVRWLDGWVGEKVRRCVGVWVGG